MPETCADFRKCKKAIVLSLDTSCLYQCNWLEGLVKQLHGNVCERDFLKLVLLSKAWHSDIVTFICSSYDYRLFIVRSFASRGFALFVLWSG